MIDDSGEWDFWPRRNRIEDLLLQRFVAGPEFSLDGYVDRKGRLLGPVCRRRVAMIAGEVAVTRTERCDAALEAAGKLRMG